MVRLPHSYVASAVELGYATTAARAQGRTVCTAHVLIRHTTTREALYVTTRARTGAHLYVETTSTSSGSTPIDHQHQPSTPMDQLAAVLTGETEQRTATEVQRQAQAHETTKRSRRQPIPTVAQRNHETFPHHLTPAAIQR